MKLFIIIPCYNEEKNIKELFIKLGEVIKKIPFQTSIVFVNDGSSDQTEEQILKIQNQNPNILYAKHDKNQGMAFAWKTGLKLCEDESLTAIIDADCQYQPKDLIKLTDESLINQYELIQGIRTERHEPFLRILMSKTFSMMIHFIFQCPLKDSKSGFLVTKKEIFEKILKDCAQFRYFQHFIGVSIHYHELKVKQIPVAFKKRERGQSFITHPLLFSLKALMDLPKAFHIFLLRKKHRF